jgi:hypothetical protein
MTQDRERPIELPPGERGLSAQDVARWDKARAELGSDRLALTERQREARLRTMAQVEAGPQVDADKAWQAEVADETARLARERGEVVERPKSGGVRVSSRDPLASLLKAGHLTAELFGVGLIVRDLYERRFAGAGSQLGGLGEAGGDHDNDRFVYGRLQNAKALLRVETIERSVAVGCQPNALAMLRVVCAQGFALSSQGEGRAFQRNAECLAAALAVAGEVLRRKQ